MRIKTFFIAALLSLSFAASAENYIINQAYENRQNEFWFFLVHRFSQVVHVEPATEFILNPPHVDFQIAEIGTEAECRQAARVFCKNREEAS